MTGSNHSRPGVSTTLPYAVTIFFSAFLLFEVQPMMAKFILPWFGGAAAVWATCLAFFQLFLLGGYAYAHGITRWLSPRAQKRIHLSLLACSALLLALLGRVWATPITPGASWKPEIDTEPAFHTLTVLTASIGLPFFVLSSTSPLLQSWFSRRLPRSSPYRFYALSNLGSLLALVGYPFAIEWLLPLRS